MTVANQFTALRPAGGFRVILADPEWSYENWSNRGAERGARRHYETSDLEVIKARPVELLAAKDAVLFLWVTWPMQPIWNEVVTAWGFEFSGLAWEWVKYNPETNKYRFGMGYGTRKNLEPCLLCTRGNPSLRKDVVSGLFDITGQNYEGTRSVRDFIFLNPLDCIRAPAREHSRKPDEQYERIETMFEGPYIELNARTRRPGWATWGNEVDKFDDTG